MSTPITKKKRVRYKRDILQFDINIPEMELDLDAENLAAVIAMEVSILHTDAISQGRRADTGGAQPALTGNRAKREVAEGKRPNQRGVTQFNKFPTEFGPDKNVGKRVLGQTKRTRVTKKGVKDVKTAKSTVGAPDYYDKFLLAEYGRGVEYLHEDGQVAELVARVLSEYLDRVEIKD